MHALIIKLRLRYEMSYPRLADITGYSPDYCRRIYDQSPEGWRAQTTLEEAHIQLLMDYEMVLDTLRPWTIGLGTPEVPPPKRAHVDHLLRVLEAKGAVLGPIRSRLSGPERVLRLSAAHHWR